jgi:raffinose/stachyose/melibiose transport system permease protein
VKTLNLRQWLWVPAFAICAVVATVVLIPLLVTFLGGLRTQGDLYTAPFSIPHALQWQNYGQILGSGSPFWREVLNSVITMVATVALLLIVACPAAFVLARMAFPGREIIFNIFLFGLLFPLTVAVLPLYLTLRQFGLLDSLWGVILPQAAFGLPFTIAILRNFFRSIPVELEDAAIVDGASPLVFFLRVLLPLARPAVSVAGIFAAVSSWNSFLLPLLVLSDQSKWTLPLGATQFEGEYSANWPLILAFLTLGMVPVILVFLAAERQIVAGLTAGAVKG